MRTLARALLVLTVSPAFALAQEGGNVSLHAGFTPNVKPSLQIARRQGSITIDGDLSDVGWKGVDRARNFAETQPLERVRPLSETEAFLTYDDDHLYVGMIAYDDPAQIRATLTGRDNIFSDDMMGIIIEPYGDAVRAYEMYSNAKGIQADVLWTMSGNDVSYDILFESEGKITDTGFQIELKIPFKSLRFPSKPVQDWKLTFWRDHPRESHHSYSWASLDRNNPCTFCQFGTLVGLEGVSSGSALEFMPAVVGKQLSRREHQLVSDPLKFEPSLGLRWAMTQATSLEATINPDFSQIETDATQIALNATSALFYPERRPFFREGYDLFDTWIDVLYTRSINDPLWATKILNRSGKLNFGFISALDESSPLIIPLEERSSYRQLAKSFVNVARATYTLGGVDFLGAMLSDRRFEKGSANTVASLDGQVVLIEALRLEAQVAASRSSGLEDVSLFDGESPQGALNGETRLGHAAHLSLERFTRDLSIDLDYWAYSPDFRAATGFVSRSNQHRGHIWAGYAVRMEDSPLLVQFQPSLSLGGIWNMDGIKKDEWAVPAISATFKGQTEMGLDYTISKELYRGVVFDGIRRLGGWVHSNFSGTLSAGASFLVGRTIARNIDTPTLGRTKGFAMWGQMKPFEGFSVSPTFNYEKLDAPTGENYFEVAILRTIFGYQFDRNLNARLIVEYSDLDRSFKVDSLISYKLNPFSVFYIGSTHGYESIGPRRITDSRETERQIFAKLQYLFQV